MTLDEYDGVIWELDYGDDPTEMRMAMERFIAKFHGNEGDRFVLVSIGRGHGMSFDERLYFDDMWKAIDKGYQLFAEDPDREWEEMYVSRVDRNLNEVGNILWMPEKMYRKDWLDPRDIKPYRSYEDRCEAKGAME
jgi:hypothetical protein